MSQEEIEKKKSELYDKEMKNRFMAMVREVFMDQTDYCVYAEPFAYRIGEKAPEAIGRELYKRLKKKGIEINL